MTEAVGIFGQKRSPSVERNGHMGNDRFPKSWRRADGMTLAELLCCIAIISILAAMYLGAIANAYVHIKKFLESQ